MDRVAEIKKRLTEALHPQSLEVIDESHLHTGHEGAKSGGGHFAVTIVSDAFKDQNTIKRHRMVYEAVGDMFPGEIHALSINSLAPDEH